MLKLTTPRYLLKLTLLLLLFLPCTLFAQTFWMQKGGSTTIDEAVSISLDDSNNTYTTGYFTGNAAFAGFHVNALGVSDVFVAKTNKNGIYKWVAKGGDAGNDRGTAVKTDHNGNTYVTGFYTGTATFGALHVTSAGLEDVFIVKYDRAGNVKWLVSGGGTQNDIGNAISVDNNGDVLVTGQFQGAATFGSFTLNANGSNVNVFTAKLDSANGNFLWAKSGVGPHTDRGLGVACDLSGNTYVTGQFTDSITFGSTHFTNLYNAIFLIKYDASGNEVWFTYAGGGTFNIANAITADANNNIYLTGDFTGPLTFFVNPNQTLGNTYANRIFIAKYTAAGGLTWAIADGSSNPITSRNIGVDGSGNCYLIGNFECILNGYADHYGQGTFNTVGYWDVFTSQYNSSGAWQWSRQIGGHNNNYGYGIAVSTTGDVYTAGSFDQDMIVPYNPANFIGYDTLQKNGCNSVYCSDNNYGDYVALTTTGNLDIFIAKPIDLSRQTYDFYIRSGNNCDRPQVSVCVQPNCADTVKFCSGGSINAQPNVCPKIGPNFTYHWSNGQNSQSAFISAQGSYTVTQTSADGCFVTKDTVYAKLTNPPAQPNLSDNVIINTNATNPQAIHICADSVKLTGGGYGGNTYKWSGGSTATTVSIEAKISGTYCFDVTDPNTNCTSFVCVNVTLDSDFVPLKPKLKCLDCKGPKKDSAILCKGSSFTLLPYDSISNPNANPANCIPPKLYVVNHWYANPNLGITFSPTTNCPDQNTFTPTDSGWYHITDTIKRKNLCDSDKLVVKDSIFVRIHPIPVLGPVTITGATVVCPGDSVLLVVHDTTSFMWNNGNTHDSIWVQAGGYSVISRVTNQWGCSASSSAFIVVNPAIVPNIVVTMSNGGTICPGDSLLLTLTGGQGTFMWQGPLGPVGGDTDKIWVKTPGQYFCIDTSVNFCNTALSNSVVVNSYSTPFLSSPSNAFICPGDSAKVVVNASTGAVIQWQAPLTGNDTVKYIKNAGTYSCKITSCGIVTTSTLTITSETPVASIVANGSKEFCIGDSVKLTANAGMASYLWSPGNSTGLSVTVKTSTVYTLTVIDTNGCRAIDTAHVLVNNFDVSPPLVSDTAICPGSIATLSVGGAGIATWYDSLGAIVGTGPTYTTRVLDSGTIYYVQINDGGCLSAVMPVDVDIADCQDIYVPNIFTPNGDGKNDEWIVTLPGATCFHVDIYNRWGLRLFSSDNVNVGWNGKVMNNGLEASDGVYYYLLNYCTYTHVQQKKDGFIQLIRSK